MKRQNKVEQILEFCVESNIEIVSFGLAPNPNGFCYELFGDACSDEANALNDMLSRLTKAEVEQLRKAVFGGAK